MLNPMTRNMERQPEACATDMSQGGQHPIELQTENGFAIIRLCDVDRSFSLNGPEHGFIVRDPNGYELETTVEISADAVSEVIWRSRRCISLAGSYWINCAERHLATYLWENDDYPPDGKLIVNQLTLDDLDLARRWNCDSDKD